MKEMKKRRRRIEDKEDMKEKKMVKKWRTYMVNDLLHCADGHPLS